MAKQWLQEMEVNKHLRQKMREAEIAEDLKRLEEEKRKLPID